jgi:pyruvate/2-oxoacid:ferredoxin oxidoreductase alpha subunit
MKNPTNVKQLRTETSDSPTAEKKSRKKPEFHVLTPDERTILIVALREKREVLSSSIKELGDDASRPVIARLIQSMQDEQEQVSRLHELVRDARLVRLSLTSDDGE